MNWLAVFLIHQVDCYKNADQYFDEKKLSIDTMGIGRVVICHAVQFSAGAGRTPYSGR